MRPLPQWVLLSCWLLLIGLLGYYVQRELVVGADLRLFLPAPTTRQQELLLEEVGRGPASRLLLIKIEGSDQLTLARISQSLTAILQDKQQFRFIANGDIGLADLPEILLSYRYLLSPTFDTRHMDADFLATELRRRLRDLASPAAILIEQLVQKDPTLETLRLAQLWQPAQEPQRIYDVWFSQRGDAVLLLAETAAAGFDPGAQQAAMEAIERAFRQARGAIAAHMTVTGAGAFSVMMKDRTERDAMLIGIVDSVAMVLLLIVAYRSARSVVLGILPLLSGGIAGLAAVGGYYGDVHGITLAFGFTLIGVAQDYPIHLLSHQHRGVTPLDTARKIWPTLATGVASTCIAYLAFLVSGVTGLAQLAVFAITGLAVAGVTTRVLLPRMMSTDARDCGDSAWLERLWNELADFPRPGWLTSAAVLASIAVIELAPQPLWENDLGALTPVPQDVLQVDAQLRSELGAPDMRYLLVVSGASAEEVLQRCEALAPRLDTLVTQGALSSFTHPAQFLPTVATQERRRGALPKPQQLREALAQAINGTAFRPGVFEPFVADVERARNLHPLTPHVLAGTPLGPRVESLLSERNGGWTGLIPLGGVHDSETLAALAANADSDIVLLDLKVASEELVAHQRQRILATLGVAALLLAVVVGMALRSVPRALRVLRPMALTTLLVVAVLHGTGSALNLFHIIALVLAAGLGLDYALFFEHAADDPLEQRRTLHAVIVCSLATFAVFAMLAVSSLPVLRGIGVTVTLGVLGNFFLALILTRPHTRRR